MAISRDNTTLLVDGNPVAQYRVTYRSLSEHRGPYPDGGHWVPFAPEYDPHTHTQITILCRAEVCRRYGLDGAALTAVEQQITAEAMQQCQESDARIQSGREAWAAMSQAERDALNDYALATEGHTID